MRLIFICVSSQRSCFSKSISELNISKPLKHWMTRPLHDLHLSVESPVCWSPVRLYFLSLSGWDEWDTSFRFSFCGSELVLVVSGKRLPSKHSQLLDIASSSWSCAVIQPADRILRSSSFIAVTNASLSKPGRSEGVTVEQVRACHRLCGFKLLHNSHFSTLWSDLKPSTSRLLWWTICFLRR